MKKKRFQLATLLITVLLLAVGCEKTDDPNRIKYAVEAQFGDANIKSKATENSWTINDQIGIYMMEAGQALSTAAIVDGAVNRRYITLTGSGEFTPIDESQRIFYPTDNSKVDFIAYYPFKQDIINFVYPIDVSIQSFPEAIDFMYSNNAKNKYQQDPVVPLHFGHRLTNFVFNITAGGSLTEADLAGLTVTMTDLYTQADISLVDGSITEKGSISDVSIKVSADGKQASAIVLPTITTPPGNRVVKFDVPGFGICIGTLTGLDWYLPGTQYIVPVEIIDDKVSIGSITIKDWEIGKEESPVVISERDFNTPNCYIVAPGGTQEIPVYKAFVMWQTQPVLRVDNPDMTGALTSGLIWEDKKGLITSTEISGTGSSADLIVRTSSALSGNAVVGLYVGGILRWSWHIWVTNYDPDQPSQNIQYSSGHRTTVFMDRNLGAMSNAVQDPASLGMYYQFGRKDPLPPPAKITIGSGVKPINLYGPNNTTPALRYELVQASPNIANSVRNPLTFYTVPPWSTEEYTVNAEWYDADKKALHNFFWSTASGEKGLYDPCPEGWRVPTGRTTDSWSSPWYLSGGYESDPATFGVTQWQNGWNFTASNFPLGYYPAGGTLYAEHPEMVKNENTSMYRDLGSAGYIWTARYAVRQATIFRISDNRVSHWQTISRRSYGMNVRCVMDI